MDGGNNWLIALLSSSTFLSAVAAVWIWVTQYYIPTKLKAREKRFDTEAEARADDREFLQLSQGDALKTVLSVNKQLIDHLLTLSNGKFDTLAKGQTRTHRQLDQMEGLQKIITSDWSRGNQKLDDIDVAMYNLEKRQEALEKLIKEKLDT